MITDPRTGTQAPSEVSAWQRFLGWVRAFEEAMDTTYDEVQDRRILALEREVVRLREIVEAGRVGGRYGLNADV